MTPSAVSIDEDGTVPAGAPARERLVSHPERSATAFKRSMGTDRVFTLAGRGIQPGGAFRTGVASAQAGRRGLSGRAGHRSGGQRARLLQPCPAGRHQRAGQLAGLTVERLINEPSAAALACYDPEKGDAAFLVYDFGGGTLDVSVVDCFENVVNILAVSGDNALGGNDFDAAIAHMYCQKNGIDYQALQPRQRAILLRQAEQCKQTLTQAPVAMMVLELEGLKGSMALTGQMLIQQAQTLFSRMRTPLLRALKDSGLSPSELQAVVPVGGSCKMPVVRQYLNHLLGQKLANPGSPDTVVALGAGMYAAMKERRTEVKELVLTDICPFTLGVGVYNPADEDNLLMSPIIERTAPCPPARWSGTTPPVRARPGCAFRCSRARRCIAAKTRSWASWIFRCLPPRRARRARTCALPMISTAFWRWRPPA